MSKRKGDLNISLEAKLAGHKADEKQSKKEGQETLITDAFKELWKHHPQQVMNRWLSDEAIVNALIGVYHHVDTFLDTGSFNGAMSRAYQTMDSKISPVGIFRVRRRVNCKYRNFYYVTSPGECYKEEELPKSLQQWQAAYRVRLRLSARKIKVPLVTPFAKGPQNRSGHDGDGSDSVSSIEGSVPEVTPFAKGRQNRVGHAPV
mgnify:CR=1 FL=1